jgi:outer membrane protein
MNSRQLYWRIGIVSLCVLISAFSLGARAQEQPARDPAAGVGELIRIGPIEKAEKDGTALRMSLRELTKLALQNNLDIAISDTNEELYQHKVLQAFGPYDPAFSITLGAQSTVRPNTNLTNRSVLGPSNTTTLGTWNVLFTQNLPTGGGIQASLNSNRSDTNQAFALFNPQYNASALVQVTQPLLRNRRIDQTRGTIRLANLDVKIGDTQFKQTVTTTIATIQGVYWDLVSAIRDYEIRRESVRLAQLSVEQNREKVRVGVLAPLEITVAQADLATRMVDLVTAEQAIKVAENNLRATISSDRGADIWQKIIVPADSPDFQPFDVDLDKAIDTALANRPELAQSDLQLQENEISTRMTGNQKKWQFDLVGSFGAVGVSGPQTFSSNGQPIIDPSLIGGFGTAYKTLFTQGFRSWFAGFNIQIPLRNRNVEGQLGQLEVQKRQLLINRKNAEQKIAVQIRNTYQDLDANRQRVETTKLARELAQLQLDGETKRFRAGMSQNFLVLQRQRDLSTAEGAELQALVAYKKSVIAIQQDMYTLLEAGDYEIAGSESKTSRLH